MSQREQERGMKIFGISGVGWRWREESISRKMNPDPDRVPNQTQNNNDNRSTKAVAVHGEVVVERDPRLEASSSNSIITQAENSSCFSSNSSWRKSYWSLVCSLSFLCTGLLRAYTSPALLSMQNEPDHNSMILSVSSTTSTSTSASTSHFLPSRTDTISWIASASPLASFLGTIVSGPCLDLLGRRQTLFILTLPAILGWLLVATAGSLSILIFGRALTGLASGLATATAPLYIAEVNRSGSRNENGRRGWLGLLPGIMLATGVLLGFFLAHVVQQENFGIGNPEIESPSWRRLAFYIMLFPVVLAFLSWTIPESPLWLETKRIEKKKKGEKLDTKFDLEMEPVVPSPSSSRQREFRPVRSQNLSEKSKLLSWKYNSPGSASSLCPVYGRVSALMIFQQFSGGNVLIYYLSEILTKTKNDASSSSVTSPTPTNTSLGLFELGPSPESVHQASLIIGLVQFIGFFLALPLIDHKRVGRRTLLMISAVLMSTAYFLLGYHFHFHSTSPVPKQEFLLESSAIGYRVVLLSLLLASYSIGLGPIPFLFIDDEIFVNSGEIPRKGNNNNTNEGVTVTGTTTTADVSAEAEKKARSYLSSVASLVNHLALFAAVKAFPYTFHLHQSGPEVTFWAFSAVCGLAAFFAFYFVPKS